MAGFFFIKPHLRAITNRSLFTFLQPARMLEYVFVEGEVNIITYDCSV